jgi:hypothetical protein
MNLVACQHPPLLLPSRSGTPMTHTFLRCDWLRGLVCGGYRLLSLSLSLKVTTTTRTTAYDEGTQEKAGEQKP